VFADKEKRKRKGGGGKKKAHVNPFRTTKSAAPRWAEKNIREEARETRRSITQTEAGGKKEEKKGSSLTILNEKADMASDQTGWRAAKKKRQDGQNHVAGGARGGREKERGKHRQLAN